MRCSDPYLRRIIKLRATVLSGQPKPDGGAVGSATYTVSVPDSKPTPSIIPSTSSDNAKDLVEEAVIILASRRPIGRCAPIGVYVMIRDPLA